MKVGGLVVAAENSLPLMGIGNRGVNGAEWAKLNGSLPLMGIGNTGAFIGSTIG